MDLPLVGEAGHHCWKVVGGEVVAPQDRGLIVVATYRMDELWKI